MLVVLDKIPMLIITIIIITIFLGHQHLHHKKTKLRKGKDFENANPHPQISGYRFYRSLQMLTRLYTFI